MLIREQKNLKNQVVYVKWPWGQVLPESNLKLVDTARLRQIRAGWVGFCHILPDELGRTTLFARRTELDLIYCSTCRVKYSNSTNLYVFEYDKTVQLV